jgi:hypothetical protein
MQKKCEALQKGQGDQRKRCQYLQHFHSGFMVSGLVWHWHVGSVPG